MMNDTLSIALSGVDAASTRLMNSAHNLANSQTPGFRNHRTDLASRRGGGVEASTRAESAPRPVNTAREAVEQASASYHFKASSRIIETELELRGTLLDVLT